ANWYVLDWHETAFPPFVSTPRVSIGIKWFRSDGIGRNHLAAIHRGYVELDRRGKLDWRRGSRQSGDGLRFHPPQQQHAFAQHAGGPDDRKRHDDFCGGGLYRRTSV